MNLRNSHAVVVVSGSSAELQVLAGYLARIGALRRYLHPLLISSDSALLSHSPGWARSELSKRRAPREIPGELVVSGAVVPELMRALLRGRAYRAERRLMRARQVSMNQAAARAARDADIVVAAHTLALDAFNAARGMRVLNLPSVHPRFRVRELRREIALRPEIAHLMMDELYDAQELERFDAEFDLADLVLVGSEFAAQTTEEFGVDVGKIRVVPYGVDLANFRPAASRDRQGFTVLFAGTVGPAKGVPDLIEAYRMFERPGSALMVVGENHERALEWGADITSLEVKSRVTSSDLAQLMRASSVLVLPSLYEGMPRVVLEAMASGLPIIGTPTATSCVVDGKSGFVVPPRSPQSIAEKLDDLASSSPSRQQAMAHEASAIAQRFTWERYCRGVHSALEFQARAL